jgi:hypothetical protein
MFQRKNYKVKFSTIKLKKIEKKIKKKDNVGKKNKWGIEKNEKTKEEKKKHAGSGKQKQKKSM